MPRGTITIPMRELEQLKRKAAQNEKKMKELARLMYEVDPARFTPPFLREKTMVKRT